MAATRILMRSPKDPFEVVSPARALEQNLILGNSGNLFFLRSAWKILSVPGVELASDRLKTSPGAADRINERYDAYVIPFANAFKVSFEPTLIQMTQLIRRLRIPVTILGVGAQSNIRRDLDRLKPIEPAVRAFVGAVLDKAPSIGVRGEFTATYLRSLGFRDVEVIGCPSMFLYGEHLHVEKRVPRLHADSRVSINVTPNVKSMGPIVRSHLGHYANLTYVAQDLDTLGMMLWGESGDWTADTDAIPVHLSHPFFRENRARLYIEPWPWIADLRHADFVFGTRIHGNIAALLAGTPAYVLAHDSRTLELAEYFEIPRRTRSQITPDLDAAVLYEEADYGPLNAGHARRFETFRGYLKQHGLPDTFSDGDSGRAFDERVARTPFPPAVEVSSMADPGSLRARVGRARYRLHQGVRAQSIRGVRTAMHRRLAGISDRAPEAAGGRFGGDRD